MTAKIPYISTCVRFVAFLVVLMFCGQAARADYKDDMGYSALLAELGANMPTGAGIPVSQVEALSGGYYAPNPTSSGLTGKTFTLKGGSLGGYSSHATTVANYFYGNTNSFAPGITSIDSYVVTGALNAADYLGGAFLRAGTYSAPLQEMARVQNNSWISTGTTPNTDIVRRFDYAIQRDNFVGVVGLNNGSTNPVPHLLADNYNGITVGMSNGNHSAGLTTSDMPGRMKPDIVASTNGVAAAVTSYVVPLVSGTAADLLQVANSKPALAAAGNSEAIKAILLAGATKTQFPNWTRTHTSPLDPVFGAGQLNIYNSYHILTAGQQVANPAATVSPAGWDFSTLSTSKPTQTYFFDVPVGTALKEFSAILTWNRSMTLLSGSNYVSASLANLNLNLYNVDGYSLGSLVDYSVSTVDNVEHIYTSLTPGRYAVTVSKITGTTTDYALAWRNRPTLPGDVNLDGMVTELDFNILKANYTRTGATWSMGDVNGDGMVSEADFNILKANYSKVLSDLGPFLASSASLSGGVTGGPAAIPEPASLGLLLAAWPVLRRARRR